MELNRKLSQEEESLIELLIKNALVTIPINWKSNLLAKSMDDGRMGSLLLFPNGVENSGRKFGSCVSEYQFTDKDGIEVIVSLNLDEKGDLFELDIWKTNFSPLIKIPEILE
jgi:hypothetical protein